jgi:hypothetical protein
MSMIRSCWYDTLSFQPYIYIYIYIWYRRFNIILQWNLSPYKHCLHASIIHFLWSLYITHINNFPAFILNFPWSVEKRWTEVSLYCWVPQHDDQPYIKYTAASIIWWQSVHSYFQSKRKLYTAFCSFVIFILSFVKIQNCQLWPKFRWCDNLITVFQGEDDNLLGYSAV